MPVKEETRSASYKLVVDGEIEVDYGTSTEVEPLEWEGKSLEELLRDEKAGTRNDHAGSDGLEASFSATDSDSHSPVSPIYPPPTPFSLSPFFLPEDMSFSARPRSISYSGEDLFRYYQTNLWNSPTNAHRFPLSQRDIRSIH